MKTTASLMTQYDAETVRGGIEGLYGRAPAGLQKLIRKIADAPDYDFAAMELLDAMNIDWRDYAKS
jgi:hypothetical protein